MCFRTGVRLPSAPPLIPTESGNSTKAAPKQGFLARCGLCLCCLREKSAGRGFAQGRLQSGSAASFSPLLQNLRVSRDLREIAVWMRVPASSASKNGSGTHGICGFLNCGQQLFGAAHGSFVSFGANFCEQIHMGSIWDRHQRKEVSFT